MAGKEREKFQWEFSGAVVRIYGDQEQVVASFYKASTWAESVARAKSNILYRLKQSMGLAPYTTMRLDGKIRKIPVSYEERRTSA